MEQVQSVIGPDVEITGNVKCESHIQLNGKLNGDLTCGGLASIGRECVLKGNVQTESVALAGTLNGNITARDKIDLKGSARLHGDIRAKRLTVEEGVTFVGKVDVNPTGTAGNKSAEVKPAPDADLPKDSAETKSLFRR
ncbi:MAG: bactofilin family protein [Kiritimatiellia bacterium]